MGIENLLKRRTETPETPGQNQGFQLQAAPAIARTPETPETPPNDNSQAETKKPPTSPDNGRSIAARIELDDGRSFNLIQPGGDEASLRHVMERTYGDSVTGFEALEGIYAAMLGDLRRAG